MVSLYRLCYNWKENEKVRFEIAIDITKRKESEERFRKLYENIAGGTMIIGNDYKIKDVNERTCEITGFNKKELIGELCVILCPKGCKSNECPIWEQGINSFQSMDTAIKCKDGKNTPILKNANKINLNGEIYILEVFQDISEKKQAEKKIKEAYNITEFYKDLRAHDMGNILNNIKASLQLMELWDKNSSKLEQKQDLFKILKQQLERGESLVYNAQKLSEIENKTKSIQSIDVTTQLKNAINHYRSRCRIDNIDIITELPQEAIRVEGGPLLVDAFENILSNASIHNDSQRKKLWISLTKLHKNGENLVKIEFKDNGLGIMDERKSVIFNRNYDKNKNRGGMGLGLSLVKKIIEEYNGTIKVQDRVEGEYTKESNFIVLLKKA
jgi:PAS domain S-box-containing protein